MICQYGLPIDFKDDMKQDACLSIVINRNAFKSKEANNVFGDVKNDVLTCLSRRSHRRAKAKVFSGAWKEGFFERHGRVVGPTEEYEARDLLETAMNRACVPTETQVLLKSYVKDPEAFYFREGIRFGSPEYTRFVRDRRDVAKVLSDILEIPLPKKRFRAVRRLKTAALLKTYNKEGRTEEE